MKELIYFSLVLSVVLLGAFFLPLRSRRKKLLLKVTVVAYLTFLLLAGYYHFSNSDLQQKIVLGKDKLQEVIEKMKIMEDKFPEGDSLK